jgi:hypothetical protein
VIPKARAISARRPGCARIRSIPISTLSMA